MKFHRSLFTLVLLGFAATCTFAADAGLGKFRPGELWLDDKGIPINAHGGGILLHDGVYYWFGEHKVEGDSASWNMQRSASITGRKTTRFNHPTFKSIDYRQLSRCWIC